MLLTLEQAKFMGKFLEFIDGETYHFVGAGKATIDDRLKLKEQDENFFEVNGFHMIDNYYEL